MKRNLSYFLLHAAGFTLCAVSAPAQTTYSLIDLGTLPGKTISHPAGINNQAQVTGFTESHAFLWTNGVMADLGTLPGGAISTGVGINNVGQVVGDSQFSQGGSIRHATLWSNGTATDLGFLPLSGNYSRGNGINDVGEVVGHSGPDLTTSNTRAFIWDAMNPCLLPQGPVPGPIVSPTGALVLAGGQDTFGQPGLIQAFSTVDGALLFEINIPKEPDGTCAVPYARARFTRAGDRAYIPAAQLCEVPRQYHSWLYAIDITTP